MALLKHSFSPIGFGAFKIGRNQGAKYESGYELPDETTVGQLLNGVLDLGINHIDTAPAYGLSEQRIGDALSHRRSEYFLSTKVGELFDNGESRHDFSAAAVRASVEQSLRRLRTDAIDLLLIHSSGDDLRVLRETDVVETLENLREQGVTRGIGFSGYTLEANRAALAWADAIMVCYHPDDASLAPVLDEAGAKGVAVIVKKGLASGRIPPAQAIPWILRNPAVSSVVVGSLNLDHLRENLQLAREARETSKP